MIEKKVPCDVVTYDLEEQREYLSKDETMEMLWSGEVALLGEVSSRDQRVGLAHSFVIQIQPPWPS